MQEIWKDIPGYEGRYKVSSFGSVMSFVKSKGGKILKAGKTGRYGRYFSVQLGARNQKYVHRLVAEAFHGSPKAGQEVRHLDGDSKNNMAENLRWGTSSENSADMVAHGRSTRGVADKMAKVNEAEVHFARYLAYKGVFHWKIAAMLGLSRQQVDKIVNYERWGWLKSDPQNYRKAA